MNAKANRIKRTQLIQKEQVTLVEIEKQLKTLLGKINESLNELKVEELQIKSNIASQYTSNDLDDLPSTSAKSCISASLIDLGEFKQFDENVNQQILELDSLLAPMKSRAYEEMDEDEEEDDEEEDDDDEFDNEG